MALDFSFSQIVTARKIVQTACFKLKHTNHYQPLFNWSIAPNYTHPLRASLASLLPLLLKQNKNIYEAIAVHWFLRTSGFFSNLTIKECVRKAHTYIHTTH